MVSACEHEHAFHFSLSNAVMVFQHPLTGSSSHPLHEDGLELNCHVHDLSRELLHHYHVLCLSWRISRSLHHNPDPDAWSFPRAPCCGKPLMTRSCTMAALFAASFFASVTTPSLLPASPTFAMYILLLSSTTLFRFCGHMTFSRMWKARSATSVITISCLPHHALSPKDFVIGSFTEDVSHVLAEPAMRFRHFQKCREACRKWWLSGSSPPSLRSLFLTLLRRQLTGGSL